MTHSRPETTGTQPFVGRAPVLSIVTIFLAMSLAAWLPRAADADVNLGNLADNVTVGGWGGFVFADNDKDGSKKYFDAHPWYFYVQAEPVDGWQFFGEIEYEHAPKASGSTTKGDIKLERLYIERNFSTAHNLRFGKTFTPFGYWYRMHWHFLTETLSRPYSFDNTYTPKFQSGVHYLGRIFRGDTQLDYYAWLGNGPDESGTNKRTVDDFGYGGSVFLSRSLGGLDTVGATLGVHTQTAAVGGSEETQDNVVAGAQATLGRAELRAEYFVHSRDLQGDVKTWYGNGLYWIVPRVGLNYRFDGGDDLKRTAGGADPKASSHSLGVVWRPHAQVLIKSEYRVNDFTDDAVVDFNEWNIFLALKY